MKLLTNDAVLQQIKKFAKEYGSEPPVFDDYKITVCLLTFSLVFFQAERYARLIACHFMFSDDVGFLFEDVCSAIHPEADHQRERASEHTASHEVLRRNDEYVLRTLKFCEENINSLTSMLPPWFPRAVQISDAASRRYFPDIAEVDFQKKQELWRSWQRSSRLRPWE